VIVEPAFKASIAALFEELPMLSGFAVSPDLRVVEIAVHTWPGWVPGRELAEQIREALEDLAVDGPEEVAQLLRGRTFARAIH